MRWYKVIGILLILFLVLPIVTNAESDRVIFNVCTPQELPKSGDTFEVSIEILNNTGFGAIQFALSYDTESMSCESIIKDEVLDGVLLATNPNGKMGAFLAAASLEPVVKNGIVATFVFRANKDISEFEFDLKNIVLADANAEDIKYEIIGGQENKGEQATPNESGKKDEPEDKTQQNTQTDGGFVVPSAKENADVTESMDAVESIPQQPTKENDTTEDETKQISAFSDVVGHWSEQFVLEAVRRGIFVGDSDGKFRPDDDVTRAQFITVLWRMSGRESLDAKVPFTDIETEIQEFKDAIAWGYAKGYISGVSNTSFDPSSPITREAGMKILHLYSGGKVGGEIQFYSIYDHDFKDSLKISPWAKAPVYWGVYNKLISGVSSDSLAPQGNATRAQLAKILIALSEIK